jgi:hypothetical protein
MPSDTPATRKPFTIFRSAAEEVEMKIAEEKWENEGGRMKPGALCVTHLPGAELPYGVVLKSSHGLALHQSFPTMREAEAFIRRNSPAPSPGLSTLYDQPASES